MIPYQSSINERRVLKKKKLPINTCLSFISVLVIFCWHVLHLLDFDTMDMISFYTKLAS